VARQQRHDLLILGEAVREIRVRRNFSADDLAAASGVSARRLAALEEGRLDVEVDLLFKLARGMGVRPSLFFRRAEELAADTRDTT
jgi:transcriptional regulator with XRE-family HTH domain